MDWFGALFSPAASADPAAKEAARRRKYPEQYPAVLDEWAAPLPEDVGEPSGLAVAVRPLLAATQLESRPLRLAYDAAEHGWTAQAFHSRVDGQGAAVVVARARGDSNVLFGGYNPKGWASMGGARPSVAAFLFRVSPGATPAKARKAGGGGLAVSVDDPDMGIVLGAEALVMPLVGGAAQRVTSRLGTTFEPFADGTRSALPHGRPSAQLSSLAVLVGVYGPGEEIPYSGAVMDMTSG